ncbi:DUF3299 domain-containing protein [Leeia sp.]|uniref:DUF3299 domain-containing protein n=1 Tax=Leeia sp. TaxID=2884678 RepID=UPI0035AFEADA
MRILALTLLMLGLAAQAAPASKPAPASPPAQPAVDPGPTLPARSDVVSWSILKRIQVVQQNRVMVPRFDPVILALEGKVVKVQGFMLPLDMTEQQKHFILSSVSPSCPYCLPAGPEGLMEVVSPSAIRFSQDPVVVQGKLVLLHKNENGLLYKLVDGKATR